MSDAEQGKRKTYDPMMGQTDLDGTLRRNVVGEVAGVEVGLEAADGDDEFRTLDLLFDLWARDRADIDLQNEHR